MLQGIPTVKEALAYKQILNDFAMATGMEVNLSKSKIFFFNTNIAIQRNISRILGFQRDSLPSKYLGVPLTAKPLHKSIWEPVINKMQDKIRKWTIRSLNLAGRLVLQRLFFNQSQFSCYQPSQLQKESYNNSEIFKETFFGARGERKKWALVSGKKSANPKTMGVLDWMILRF
jgi:hypothetical protein